MKKRFVKCGHLGLGQFCHRCSQAERLAKQLEDKKWLKSQPEGTAEKLKKEAERLLAVPTKQSNTNNAGAPAPA